MESRFIPLKRRKLGPVLSLAGGIAIGVALVLSFMTIGGLSLLSHKSCTRHEAVATALFWTPFELLNAPYLGSASYLASFQLYELNGLTNVTASGTLLHGNLSSGYFETQNWMIFSLANSSEAGPGVNRPCESAFSAAIAPTNFTSSFQGFVLQGPGNTSNMNEPTTYPKAPPQHPSAVFANAFVAANHAPVSTCGSIAQSVSVSSALFEISLSVTGPMGVITTSAIVVSLENFTYHFPANGGTWQVDNLSAPGGPGGGWAFSYSSCS